MVPVLGPVHTGTVSYRSKTFHAKTSKRKSDMSTSFKYCRIRRNFYLKFSNVNATPLRTTSVYFGLRPKALFTRARYRTVLLRSVPKSGTERGCVHTGTEKIKWSVPNRSRNWAVRKSGPEIRTIRYRTVPFPCEQKPYDIVPLSGPVWYLRVTPSWFL